MVEYAANRAYAAALSHRDAEVGRLREALRIAERRFSDQNGHVSAEVWNGNYEAVNAIANALAAAPDAKPVECAECRRLRFVLECVEARLVNILTVFRAPNFTDRHGDGDLTERLLENVRAALAAAPDRASAEEAGGVLSRAAASREPARGAGAADG